MERIASRARLTEVRRFPNGDTYTGGWSSGLPDGEGSYRWADGSEYSGQWVKGQKSGVGRYTWPSGATYQGEWVDGVMQGVGTFQAVDGTSYTGSWLRNMKHGLGKKIYANRDCYEGLWRNGKSWGPGRYMWVDGNEYDGEWSNGVMHGQGTFVWRSGERYDGEWKNGLEDGQGVFTWPDGSIFDGFWSKGRKHGVGLFRIIANPKPANHMANSKCLPMGEDDNSADLASPMRNGSTWAEDEGPVAAPMPDKARTGAGSPTQERAGPAPTERMFIREYDRGRVLRHTPVQGSDVLAMLSALVGENQAMTKRKRANGKLDKVGEVIDADHRSYELMLDLQLGVRWSLTKFDQGRTVKSPDFAEKVKVLFPREGSRETPPHQMGSFRWKDYAPAVFAKLRRIFMVDAGEYLQSICGDQALRELSSPGKSGALFYISHDNRFLIKTMLRHETKTFMAMLPHYFQHVQSNPHTLLTKFYGLYRIQLVSDFGRRKVRFIVMGNIYNAGLSIHQQYDLKGSTQGRTCKDKAKRNAVWKDLDLEVSFQLSPEWKERLFRQLDKDTVFLQDQYVMDYSLLMGVHYKDREQVAAPEIAGQRLAQEQAETRKKYMQKIVSWNLPDTTTKDIVFLVHAQLRRKQKRAQHLSQLDGSLDRHDPGELAFELGEKRVQLGLGMQAKALDHHTGEEEDAVIYFGIIDFMQEYTTRKRAEHAYKSVRYDGRAISVVDPVVYARRFSEFMRDNVFC